MDTEHDPRRTDRTELRDDVSTSAEILEIAAGPVGLLVRLGFDRDVADLACLETAGLIAGTTLERDEESGPVVLFTLTSQGRELMKAMGRGVSDAMSS